MDGEAVQIVKISEDEEHTFYLDEEALTRVLCQDEIKDKPVCILSVAGRLFLFSQNPEYGVSRAYLYF